MTFNKLFEGRSLPEITERLGVMSVDTLNRMWLPVLEENGCLVAVAKNWEGALVGRMGKRDDGKFCVERVVKAKIEDQKLVEFESWHVDVTDRQRQAQWLEDVLERYLRLRGMKE
jgi:hypothetical protein